MPRATQSHYSYRANPLVAPSMAQFVVLSVLLHVWVILLFGDASGMRGSGLGVGRTFLATLERAASPAASVASPRRVRRGAATDGASERADARISPQPSSVPAASAATQENVAAPTGPVAAPVEPPVFEKLPILTIEAKATATPFAIAPIPIETAPALPSPPSAPLPAFTAIAPISGVPKVVLDEAGFAVYVAPIAERAQPAPVPLPMLATPLLSPLVKPAADPEFASYVPPPVIAPAPLVESRPPSASPAVASPVEAPMAAVPPLIAPPSVPVAPGPLPASATAPIEPLKMQPASKRPEIYAPAAPVTTTIAPVENTVPTPRTGAPSADRDMSAATIAPSTSGGAVPRAVSPQVNSSTSVGPPALLNFPLPIPAPTAPAVATPRLDLDALRRQAREVAREGGGARTLLPFATVGREPPKKDMEKIFDKALKRPDCKDAYADLGLAAFIPLVRDAVGDGGCKW